LSTSDDDANAKDAGNDDGGDDPKHASDDARSADSPPAQEAETSANGEGAASSPPAPSKAHTGAHVAAGRASGDPEPPPSSEPAEETTTSATDNGELSGERPPFPPRNRVVTPESVLAAMRTLAKDMKEIVAADGTLTEDMLDEMARHVEAMLAELRAYEERRHQTPPAEEVKAKAAPPEDNPEPEEDPAPDEDVEAGAEDGVDPTPSSARSPPSPRASRSSRRRGRHERPLQRRLALPALWTPAQAPQVSRG
jgi:hypothetical protein